MKIVVLVDNTPHPTQNLYTEHGLCVYIETQHNKILFDAGSSDKFFYNAQQLGIRIEDVDFLIISHGHYDHIGGLEQFLKINNHANIFLSAYIRNYSFYSYSHHRKRNISFPGNISAYNNRLVWVTGNREISSNVAIISNIPKIYPVPKANNKLFKYNGEIEQPDDFKHEMLLAIRTKKGQIIFSGCSHRGILNILQAGASFFNNDPVIACIGGTHLIDSNDENTYETASEIEQIGKAIQSSYPQMRLITGHCTGKTAKNIFEKILDVNFTTFYSGFSWQL